MMMVNAKTNIKLGRLNRMAILLNEPELILGSLGSIFAKVRQTSAAPMAIKAKVLRQP